MRWMMVAAGVCSLTSIASAQQSNSDAALTAMRRTNDKIQFANYPRASLRRGEEGIVGIKVTTDKQGRLRDCEVASSSGFPALDEASCDMLIANMKMRPFIAPNGGGIVQHQTGQVVWKLPEGYTARAVPINAGKPVASRKICRAQTKTGSLIASQRICLTRGEWQRQYIQAQEELQDMKPKLQYGG